MKQRSVWNFLIYLLGLHRVLYHVKLLHWLLCFILTALRQCGKTADLKELLVFYKKALVATFRLYLLLSKEEKKSRQTKRLR